MELAVIIIALYAVAALWVSYKLVASVFHSLADESSEKTYWRHMRANRIYNDLRRIYQNPELVHKASARKMKVYLRFFNQLIPPFDKYSYTDMAVLLVSSKNISRKQLMHMWAINSNNRTVREAIIKNHKLPESLKISYALELLSDMSSNSN